MKNVPFVVIVKQPIVFSKQPIVFPLAPLYNAIKFAYAWLNHFSFSNLDFGQIYIECASESDNKRLYPLVFLKALYHFLFLEMSTLFVLLVYYIIILISALYNPSHFLFVRANRGSCLCLIWLYKIALKLMHYVVVSLHLKTLDYFTFLVFYANVVYWWLFTASAPRLSEVIIVPKDGYRSHKEQWIIEYNIC